ncbi:zinc finger, CCHC-type containing protein [Tanacetum coccineum]
MTAPYTPQQNGISERKNRVPKEMVNFMLSYSGLIQWFWGEAMLTACYLLNRVPNKRNKITPYELWTKKKPNLNYLRIWGCRAVVRLPDLKLKTLGERAIECIFVGYAEHSKAFRFYVIEPNESVSINSISVSRDAIFDENRFSSVPRPSLRIPNREGVSLLRFDSLRLVIRFAIRSTKPLICFHCPRTISPDPLLAIDPLVKLSYCVDKEFQSLTLQKGRDLQMYGYPFVNGRYGDVLSRCMVGQLYPDRKALALHDHGLEWHTA